MKTPCANKQGRNLEFKQILLEAFNGEAMRPPEPSNKIETEFSSRVAREVRAAINGPGIPVPFDRSYWVVPRCFLAGAYPGDLDPVKTEANLRSFISVGIRGIIDLTRDGDCSQFGLRLLTYRGQWAKIGADLGLGLAYHHRPITDLDVPLRDEMNQTLGIIDKAIENDRPIYVHCLGGIGRTGTVVGCWLARHGIERGSEILEVIQKLRRGEAGSYIPSPETERQRRFVCGWQQGD